MRAITLLTCFLTSVESLVIYGGERWDFVINANKNEGVYWIKFRGLLACGESFQAAYQVSFSKVRFY